MRGPPTAPLIEGTIVGRNTDADDYHDQKHPRGHPGFIMSRSELMEFDHCPQRWLRGYKQEPTDALEFGDMLDTLLTQPKAFKRRFSVEPLTYISKKTGEVKKWNNNADVCRKWREKQGERLIVKENWLTDAGLAKQRLTTDPIIAGLLPNCHFQVMITAIYPDKGTGLAVPIKCLVDMVPTKHAPPFYAAFLADFKTARSADPNAWQRAVFQQDYHVQAAMYLDAYKAACPKAPKSGFLHVIVENVAPFEPARRMLSQEFIEVGRARYLAALARYCQCLKDKRWPGYDDYGNEILEGWRLVQPEAWMIL